MPQEYKDEFEGEEINARLYIGNLDYKATVGNIRESFGKFGEIVAIQIKSGFAFVVKLFF